MKNFDATGRLYFNELTADDYVPSPVTGAVRVNLPVYKSDKSAFLDSAQPNIAWNFNVSQLGQTLPVPTAPQFANAFNQVDLSNSLNVMADGWDGLFTVLDKALDSQAFVAQIPLIGDQLKDAARFITDLRDRVSDNLRTAGTQTITFVRQKLYEAVGPAA